jgi:hypothetical protein
VLEVVTKSQNRTWFGAGLTEFAHGLDMEEEGRSSSWMIPEV